MRNLLLTTTGLVSVFACATLAVAAPVPINTSFLTPSAGSKGDTITFSGTFSQAFPYLICPSGVSGCGGSFRAGITNTANSTIGNVSLWCVDSQLSVSKGQIYTASIVSLNTPAASFDIGSEVRYGNVGLPTNPNNPGNKTWDLAIAGYSDALSRYRLAATLLMQYQSDIGDQGGHDIADPLKDSPQNQAIQRAIWEITQNNDYGSSVPLTGDISTGAGGGTWIAWAIAHVSQTNFNQWAVVSGAYQPNPSKGNTYQLDYGGSRIQTFLVEVVPEPGFYGVLSLGLVGLFLALYRRRKPVSI